MATRAELHSAKTRFSWAWVVVGIVLGTLLIATLVTVVRNEPPRPDVAVLIGILTFALMGILVGFHSPGLTIREPGVSGLALALLSLVAFRGLFGMELSPGWSVAILVLGPLLALGGGWVGEMLQGTLVREGSPEGLEWSWVVVGTILGVMLNCYAVFVLHALFALSPVGVFVAFSGSFFVTAAFVGYFSPGVTIVEPALAAFLVIVVDFALVLLGFRAPFPLLAVAIAAAGAFVIALAGGYVGEVAHNLRWRSAWGGEAGTYQEVAKPGT